jgi:hypothetical protein
MTAIHDVARRTLLTTLELGAWRPVRLHHGETRAENERHQTTAAKVLVRISDHPALARIAKIQAAAYRDHRQMTLPTIMDGFRLVPVARELEHSEAMRAYKIELDAQVREFIDAYDDEKARAPERLNGLYDPAMWLEKNEVEKRFRLHVEYLPCPTDGAWANWLAESVRAAESELRERLTECVQSIITGCNGNLHASAFDKLARLLDVLPDLNFANDAAIANMASQLRPIAAIDPETLRHSKPHRDKTAEIVGRMLSNFQGL